MPRRSGPCANEQCWSELWQQRGCWNTTRGEISKCNITVTRLRAGTYANWKAPPATILRQPLHSQIPTHARFTESRPQNAQWYCRNKHNGQQMRGLTRFHIPSNAVNSVETKAHLGVLCDFNLLHQLTQRSTVTRTVLTANTDFLCALALEKQRKQHQVSKSAATKKSVESLQPSHHWTANSPGNSHKPITIFIIRGGTLKSNSFMCQNVVTNHVCESKLGLSGSEQEGFFTILWTRIDTTSDMSNSLDRLQEALSGAVGAAISTSALYPLEISKTIMQSRTGKDASADTTLTILAKLLSQSGPAAVYKGWPAKTVQSVVQAFGYFYFYAMAKQVIAMRRGSAGGHLTTVENLIAGYLAGVCNIGMSIPLEVRILFMCRSTACMASLLFCA